jgi:hypothetical protein
MRTYSLIVLIFLISVRITYGQTLQIRSPFANEEYCQSTSIPIAITVKNPDTVAQTLITRFEIRNIVTKVGLYSHKDTFYNIPPGTSVDTSSPSYQANAFLLSQLGSSLACAYVTAIDPSGFPIPDWKFADSSCVRLYGIRTTALPFNDPEDGYSKTASANIPDQTKWVSIGATIVDGDIETWDPPPPGYDSESGGVGPSALLNPVIRMDRRDANGNLYFGNGVGDTLTSFPFNLKGQTKAVFAFDFMRGDKRDYSALSNSDVLSGPETTVRNNAGNVIRPGDSLIVEFKNPDDSACNPPAKGWKKIVGIDGGRDFDFQSVFIFMHDSAYFTPGFRYRIRLQAKNDGDLKEKVNDDDDPFYIDHISLQVPRRPEIEIKWVRVITPYSKIPFSSVTDLPVYIRIRNHSSDVAIAFAVKILITNDRGDTMYFKIQNVNSLRSGADSLVRFPDWNAQNAGSSSKFFVSGYIASSSYDDYTQDNRASSIFSLNVDHGDNAIQEFAYDDAGIHPTVGEGNDIPFLNLSGKSGVGFHDVSGSYAMKFILPQADTIFGARIYFAGANPASDAIRLSVFKGDSNFCIPGPVAEHVSEAVRHSPFDQFTPYWFAKPVLLPAGIHWLSVSQLALNSFTMGGDLSRGAGQIVVADSNEPQITPVYNDPYGTQWSPDHNNGDVSCAFAVETPASSGQWQPWMPAKGVWPTNASGSAHQDVAWNPHLSAPYDNAGSFLPMIRVISGSHTNEKNHIASDDNKDISIHMEADFVSITNPLVSSIKVTLFDLLGRISEEREIAPGEKGIFLKEKLPRQVFIGIHFGNSFKVFKILN